MNKGTNLANIFDIAEVEKLKDAPMDGDGEENEDGDLINISVDIALNGYTVIYNYDDGSELKYVFLTFEEVLEQMRKNH